MILCQKLLLEEEFLFLIINNEEQLLLGINKIETHALKLEICIGSWKAILGSWETCSLGRLKGVCHLSKMEDY